MNECSFSFSITFLVRWRLAGIITYIYDVCCIRNYRTQTVNSLQTTTWLHSGKNESLSLLTCLKHMLCFFKAFGFKKTLYDHSRCHILGVRNIVEFVNVINQMIILYLLNYVRALPPETHSIDTALQTSRANIRSTPP